MSDLLRQILIIFDQKRWLKYINREIEKAEKCERKAKRLSDKADVHRFVARRMVAEYDKKFRKENVE